MGSCSKKYRILLKYMTRCELLYVEVHMKVKTTSCQVVHVFCSITIVIHYPAQHCLFQNSYITELIFVDKSFSVSIGLIATLSIFSLYILYLKMIFFVRSCVLNSALINKIMTRNIKAHSNKLIQSLHFASLLFYSFFIQK